MDKMKDPSNDPIIQKWSPFGEYEYVDVEFPAANTDTLITYTNLRPEDPESVKWIDITPGTVYDSGGPTDTPAYVYRSSSPTRKSFGSNYVQLRSTVAGYQTTLLLFVERE